MVSPLPVEEDATGHPAFDNDGIRAIRAKYTQCGVYRNDGSTIPLWTLRYRLCQQPLLLDDGQHLVLADTDWFQSRTHVATFYANGRLLARHQLDDLVTVYQVSGHFLLNYPQCRSLKLDPAKLELTLRTTQGETIVFDVTTGRVVRRSSLYPRLLAAAGLVCLAIFGTIATFWFRQRKGVKKDLES